DSQFLLNVGIEGSQVILALGLDCNSCIGRNEAASILSPSVLSVDRNIGRRFEKYQMQYRFRRKPSVPIQTARNEPPSI
ncbi:MAG: hypothetical protein ACXV7F_12875, partial [Methylomonas sp.]